MAVFYFRLENILKLRERIEQNKLIDFSRKRQKLLELERELSAQAGKLSDFIRDNHFEGIFTASEIMAVDNYIYRLRKKIDQLRENLRKREEEARIALQELTEAKKSRKVMENLKARHWERFLLSLKREEEAEVDEINQKINLNRERLTIEDIPTEEM